MPFSGSRASLIWWSNTRSFPPPFENWTAQKRGLRVNGAEISSRLAIIGQQQPPRRTNGTIAPQFWKTLSFLTICTISKRSVIPLCFLFFFRFVPPGEAIAADLWEPAPHRGEQGHYDGVIRRFREMRVSTWDGEDDPILKSALGRLETLYPNADATQTHLLHLASNGEILPHVDNIGASGSWILGVSLGSERILRMEPVEDDVDGIPRCPFDISLPSGSVYIQK